jgi:hypothetical protein
MYGHRGSGATVGREKTKWKLEGPEVPKSQWATRMDSASVARAPRPLALIPRRSRLVNVPRKEKDPAVRLNPQLHLRAAVPALSVQPVPVCKVVKDSCAVRMSGRHVTAIAVVTIGERSWQRTLCF